MQISPLGRVWPSINGNDQRASAAPATRGRVALRPTADTRRPFSGDFSGDRFKMTYALSRYDPS